jgi:hypothetical protein
MISTRLASARVALFLILIPLNLAQQSKIETSTVTITEPAVTDLQGLFKQADIVALVKIVSGDDENYKIAIYKGEVLTNFKGTRPGDTIFFGPYTGQELGSEYLLFLRKIGDPIAPNRTSTISYGAVHYAVVFNEGYSSMIASYECVFDGKVPSESCDYGVRVCTDYIKLPKSLRTFPPRTATTDFGCRWARKKALMAMLENLQNPNK